MYIKKAATAVTLTGTFEWELSESTITLRKKKKSSSAAAASVQTHHHRPLLLTAPVPESDDTSRMQAAFTPRSSARLLIVSVTGSKGETLSCLASSMQATIVESPTKISHKNVPYVHIYKGKSALKCVHSSRGNRGTENVEYFNN